MSASIPISSTLNACLKTFNQLIENIKGLGNDNPEGCLFSIGPMNVAVCECGLATPALIKPQQVIRLLDQLLQKLHEAEAVLIDGEDDEVESIEDSSSETRDGIRKMAVAVADIDTRRTPDPYHPFNRRKYQRTGNSDREPGYSAASASGIPSLNEYFVDGDGINRGVMEREICRFIGPDALSRPGTYTVRLSNIYRYLFFLLTVNLANERIFRHCAAPVYFCKFVGRSQLTMILTAIFAETDPGFATFISIIRRGEAEGE
ncbi:MAG: hypothetical protein Q9170_007030 [Blastenia crenularia]